MVAEKTENTTEPQHGVDTRPHQPGQAAFRSVLPEEIYWRSFPAFPPSLGLAVVVGEPSAPGPYVIRVKAPSGGKLMPHSHPEDRVYTVISGVFYIGLGDKFDADKLRAGRTGTLSNLTVPRAFEAAKLIRRKCADFHQGPGLHIVTHAPLQRGRIYGCNRIIASLDSICRLAPRGAVHIWAQSRSAKEPASTKC